MGIKNFIHSKIQLIEKGPLNKASSYNTFRSAVNEGRMAYYLNGKYDHENNTLVGGKYNDSAHRSMVEGAQKKLEELPGEYDTQDARAKVMALAFLRHAHEQGYKDIKRVGITNKQGDIKKFTGKDIDQKDNASDLMAEFNKKPPIAKHGFLGASAKSSTANKIGFHNGGSGDIGKFLNYNILEEANNAHSEFAKEHGLSNVKSQRADELKARPDLYTNALAKAEELHTKIRDKLVDLYNQKSEDDHEELRSHLLNTFLKASQSDDNIPYVKVSGKNRPGKEPTAVVEETHDNPVYHAIKNAKKITMEPAGGAYIHVKADGEKQFSMQVKHNSTPMATSIKINGQP